MSQNPLCKSFTRLSKPGQILFNILNALKLVIFKIILYRTQIIQIRDNHILAITLRQRHIVIFLRQLHGLLRIINI